MEKRIAVVTGSNRGIGLEISRQLAAQGIHVVMTARNEAEGRTAMESLRSGENSLSFHPLDVADESQRKALHEHISKEYGRLDILVNNAGVYLDAPDASGPSESVFEAHFDTHRKTNEVNLYGPWRLCQLFVPMMVMQDYGRIVNMSSGLGQLEDMAGKAPAYRLSKVALNALTRIMAAELAGTNVLVNCMNPGWVRTRMGGPSANRDVAEGADTAVFLATLPDGGPSGLFFRDRKPVPW